MPIPPQKNWNVGLDQPSKSSDDVGRINKTPLAYFPSVFLEYDDTLPNFFK